MYMYVHTGGGGGGVKPPDPQLPIDFGLYRTVF